LLVCQALFRTVAPVTVAFTTISHSVYISMQHHSMVAVFAYLSVDMTPAFAFGCGMVIRTCLMIILYT